MAIYMANRIIEGAYAYEYVISKRPGLKSGIDDYLTSIGRTDLLTAEQKEA